MIDIKETKEVFEFLTSTLNNIAKAKADDGKVSMAEAVRIAVEAVPKSVNAIKGIDKVDDELKDLSKEELEELALLGVALANAAMAAFMGVKK